MVETWLRLTRNSDSVDIRERSNDWLIRASSSHFCPEIFICRSSSLNRDNILHDCLTFDHRSYIEALYQKGRKVTALSQDASNDSSDSRRDRSRGVNSWLCSVKSNLHIFVLVMKLRTCITLAGKFSAASCDGRSPSHLSSHLYLLPIR
jgi:hypothetical protein